VFNYINSLVRRLNQKLRRVSNGIIQGWGVKFPHLWIKW
jgi:hypothetical protein